MLGPIVINIWMQERLKLLSRINVSRGRFSFFLSQQKTSLLLLCCLPDSRGVHPSREKEEANTGRALQGRLRRDAVASAETARRDEATCEAVQGALPGQQLRADVKKTPVFSAGYIAGRSIYVCQLDFLPYSIHGVSSVPEIDCDLSL